MSLEYLRIARVNGNHLDRIDLALQIVAESLQAHPRPVAEGPGKCGKFGVAKIECDSGQRHVDVFQIMQRQYLAGRTDYGLEGEAVLLEKPPAGRPSSGACAGR